MTDNKHGGSKQQAKTWKAIQMQVQSLAKKAQQAKVEKAAKSQ